MREILHAYQDAVTGEVGRLGGHLAKLMGDGVLAYFGWPRAEEDDPERAVQAGLNIIQAVRRLSSPFGEPLAARVGIATGLVVVGDLIGEGAAREEAVVGQTPNLAARLQEVAPSGAVVIASGTRRLLGNTFDFRDLGPVHLKGFDRPVNGFEVLRPTCNGKPVRRTSTRPFVAYGRARPGAGAYPGAMAPVRCRRRPSGHGGRRSGHRQIPPDPGGAA